MFRVIKSCKLKLSLQSPSILLTSTSSSSTRYYANFSNPSGLGVLRESEADDINVLVQNYTSPALARALREKELTLQHAARLCETLPQSFEELKELLLPYTRDRIQRRRKKKHDLNLSESSEGFTKRELVILQRYLHRMPRHVSGDFGRRASVVIPLCNVDGVASILFEKRSKKVRTHKQEVCFPGGMVDEGVSVLLY